MLGEKKLKADNLSYLLQNLLDASFYEFNEVQFAKIEYFMIAAALLKIANHISRFFYMKNQ